MPYEDSVESATDFLDIDEISRVKSPLDPPLDHDHDVVTPMFNYKQTQSTTASDMCDRRLPHHLLWPRLRISLYVKENSGTKCRAFDCDLGCQIDVTHYYCEDIDECTTETDNCVPGEACVINEGSLRP